jgi:hypothetical protein
VGPFRRLRKYLIFETIMKMGVLLFTMNDSLQKEIDELKKLSKSKLKWRLLLYKILLFLNSDNFTFVFSLLWCILPLLFFSFSILLWSGVLLLHYFIFWKKVKPYLDQKFQTEKENEEMREIIGEFD